MQLFSDVAVYNNMIIAPEQSEMLVLGPMGIIIRSGSELEQFDQLLSNLKVVELAKKIEAVNPKNKEDAAANTSSNTEVFDI